MSKEKEILDAEFRKWKEEIERRCAEHLKKHPEKPNEKTPQGLLPSNSTVSMRGRIRVFVLESTQLPGAWMVYRNDENNRLLRTKCP